MRAWLRGFSTDRPRWGSRRAAKMARRAGWQVNNKRIRRLWRDEGLRVPQRRKKKRLTGIGVAVGAMSPIRPNVIWAMGFQFDTTADGRTLKMLNVIDEFTREALAINADRGIDADGVVEVLDRLALQRGGPHYVRFDNGPEFVAHAVSDWCRFNSAGSLFIDPGSPWQNAWIESFNGRLRDELLNSWRFDSLLEATRDHRRLALRLQRQQAPLRPRRVDPIRVRSAVGHDPSTPSRIATGPPKGPLRADVSAAASHLSELVAASLLTTRVVAARRRQRGGSDDARHGPPGTARALRSRETNWLTELTCPDSRRVGYQASRSTAPEWGDKFRLKGLQRATAPTARSF